MNMTKILRYAILSVMIVMGSAASAQRYFVGEELHYRAAYRAMLIPNTEVGEVSVTTPLDTLDGNGRNCVECNDEVLERN